VTTFARTSLEQICESEQVPVTPPARVPCWISFGGNVGDVKATFDAALALLSLHCHIELTQRSGLYCTLPMGSQAGNPFLNSVCGLSTSLSACALLSVLQSVETQLGRLRDVRWGPRTLDLDLLSYGHHLIDEPKLVVPHPALTYRRFVLDPLVEIAPEWRHPACSGTTRQLLDRLIARPLRVALLEVPFQESQTLAAQLRQRFPHVEIVPEADAGCQVVPIRMISPTAACKKSVVDLRRSPGDMLEQLTSALTAIFDVPQRISDW
jgi:2-amino-4-hydroxy-6-hydroxymethyldihydropteridine diphosphokinase